MVNIYYKLKLWYWWNFTIKKDEFHDSLSYWNIHRRYNNIKKASRIALYRRSLAHRLDYGTRITDIPTAIIKRAEI